MPKAKELAHIPVLLIACVLLVVGVSTDYWQSGGVKAGDHDFSVGGHGGLFKVCGGAKAMGFGVTGCGDRTDQDAPKGLVVAGIVIGGLVTLMMIAYIFLKDSNSNLKQMPKACAVAGIIGAVLIIIGAVIFAFDVDKNVDYDYSFYVTLVGALLLIVGSALSSKA